MNKHHLTLCLALSTLSVGNLVAQEPAVPPPLAAAPAPPAPPVGNPPVPPVPPAPPARPEERRHGQHEGPLNYLGIGVAPIPEWFSEQLNLPEGFGLLVNYVAPGSPAEAAGVKAHDVLKQVNDQLLANTDQLVSLVATYSEGQTVTLTVLRKGQDIKLSAKLEKRTAAYVPDMTIMSAADAADDFKIFNKSFPKEILDQLGPEIRETFRNAGREAADQIKREIMILREKNGGVSTSKLDLGRGHMVFRDKKGVVEITGKGKEGVIVAKDPQGKVIYNGPAQSAPANLLGGMIHTGDDGNLEVTSDTSASFYQSSDDASKASPSPASP